MQKKSSSPATGLGGKKSRHTHPRLTLLHKALTYGSLAALLISGLAWKRKQPATEDFLSGDAPVSLWWMRIHGAAGMIFLVVLGTLLPIHFRRQWKDGKNRSHGVFLSLYTLLQLVTGYLLYYPADGVMMLRVAGVHEVLGFGLPAMLIWHAWLGRKSLE